MCNAREDASGLCRADPGSIDQVTAAFNRSQVAARVVHGPSSPSDPVQVSQVVLSREDFEVLIASYRAFVRAEKTSCANEAGRLDDFDPFDDRA